MAIAKIMDAYVIEYRDGSFVAYVEWIDELGRSGLSEGSRGTDCVAAFDTHMFELFMRATREGVKTRLERCIP